MANWTIHAECDPKDNLWFVRSSDMPGLWCDAETLPALERKISAMMEDLLEINAEDLSPEQLQGPHRVRVLGSYQHDFDIAA